MHAYRILIVMTACLLGFSGTAVEKGGATLEDVVILTPANGGTIFVDPNLGAVVLPVLAHTNNVSDTEVVEFFLARQGEPIPGQRVGNDISSPYLIDARLGSTFGLGQIVTLVVRATSLSDPDVQPFVTAQFGYTATMGDQDYNGLPDNPADILWLRETSGIPPPFSTTQPYHL